MCTLRPPCKHYSGTGNYLDRVVNSQRDVDFTSNQFASISSDVKNAGPMSMNPK